MLKRGISLFCMILFLALSSVIAYADGFEEPDIKMVVFKTVLRFSDEPIKVNNKIYVPVRSISEYFGAAVLWNSSKNEAVVICNGKRVVPKIQIINGKSYAFSSFLEESFGYTVTVYNDYNTVVIDKKGEKTNEKELRRILPGYKSYSEEDLTWLAKIVHAEARGEDYSSKLAVANVILNRRANKNYPDTIHGVIFDKSCGVQFTPTINGAINNTPSAHSYLAAIEALEGKNNSSDTLFFINPKIAKSSWVSKNRSFAFAMGNHNFYY